MIPIILPGAELESGMLYNEDWPEAMHHLLRVRRLRVGMELLWGNGLGQRVRAKVTEIGKKSLTVEVLERFPDVAEPKLTLWLPLLEKSALEEACYLVGQLSIGKIVLTTSEFTSVPTKERVLREQQIVRLERILMTSCIQSEQAWLPDLETTPIAFEDLPWGEGRWFVAMERGAQAGKARTGAAQVLIGPEGGWSPRERAVLHEKATSGEIEILDLGTSILRAQTAALISCWDVLRK